MENHAIGQCKSWLDGGLQPRANDVRFDWGVDVPHDVPRHFSKKYQYCLVGCILLLYFLRPVNVQRLMEKNGKKYWKDDDCQLITS
ncbi:MAG: hypothetical protein IPL23_13045 [Saprospiraceae bacterium]|nr:hypothetical protein [Saprospiraceae bacterium]